MTVIERSAQSRHREQLHNTQEHSVMKHEKRKQWRRQSPAILVALLVSLQILAPAAHADDGAPKRSAFTFIAKPYAEAKNYMICEFGLKTQLTGTRFSETGIPTKAMLDLGMMHNVDEKTAVGASVYGTMSEHVSGVGFRARVRRWLDNSRGVDITAGLLIYGVDDDNLRGEVKSPGLIASMSVDAFRWLAVDLTFESVRTRFVSYYDQLGYPDRYRNQTVKSLYLGVNGKDFGAAVGITAVSTAILIALASWSSSIS